MNWMAENKDSIKSQYIQNSWKETFTLADCSLLELENQVSLQIICPHESTPPRITKSQINS